MIGAGELERRRAAMRAGWAMRAEWAMSEPPIQAKLGA